MTTAPPSVPAKGYLHVAVTIVLAGMFAWVLFREFTDAGLVGAPDVPLQMLIVVAALSSLVAHARQLPWQYVLAAAGITATLGSVAFLTTQNAGIPFGPLVFGPAAGEQIASKLPWTIPVLWVVVVFNSRGVARLMLRPWRKLKTYGFWLMGITAALVMLFDLGLDPFLARQNHFWIWQPTKFPVTWERAPLINFPAWAFVTLLILAFATPLLIKKQPGQKHMADYHPLCVWAGGLVFFAVVAGHHGLWPAVTLDGAVIVAALVPAIRGGRW